MKSITVYHLGTNDSATYCDITPTQAVIAAHAQSLGDFNTWEYETRYGHLSTQGARTVACGDFAALDQTIAFNVALSTIRRNK